MQVSHNAPPAGTPLRISLALALSVASACTGVVSTAETAERQDPPAAARERMVVSQIERRGVSDPAILGAMRRVPRHRFVPQPLESRAYDDTPLPIGDDQTISQPYIVAYMTEALRLGGDARVLEVGTGSGYQAAVLAELAAEVFTIEIVPSLADRSGALLAELGYANVTTRTGDGYRGWPDAAPFDAIIVTAAPDHVPPALVEQLKVGARLVIPVGRTFQALTIITKTEDGTVVTEDLPVRFVPMTGEARSPR